LRDIDMRKEVLYEISGASPQAEEVIDLTISVYIERVTRRDYWIPTDP